jgi:sec-independent protein translocase protein TatB
MLGVGMTEMLVIGVVALIVIGPRELPALMQRMGKVMGTIRRMGQDFQREINKTTGLDAVTDLRKTITEPLKKTTAEIRKEFNAIGSNGTVKPTGVIKPTDPKVESVVDSIKQQAGMTTPAEPVKAGAAAAPAAASTAPVKAAVLPKVPAQPTAPVAAADLPTIEASAPAHPSPLRGGAGGGGGSVTPTPDPVAKTPRKRTAKPKAVDSPAPIEAIAPSAPKPRASRKKPAPKVGEPAPESDTDKPADGA